MNNNFKSTILFLSEFFNRRPIFSVLRNERIKHLIAGGITAAVHFGIFSGAWLVMRGVVSYPLVAIGSQAMTVASVYPLYRIVVFRATGSWLLGVTRFYIACVASLLLSVFCLLFLVEIANVSVLLAQVITIVWSPVFSYSLQRSWAFRSHVRD